LFSKQTIIFDIQLKYAWTLKLLRLFVFLSQRNSEQMKQMKQYPDKVTFTTTGDLIDFLRTNKGIRPPDGFSMITLYIDDECLKFKSHKGAIKVLDCVVFHTYFECFRNFGKGFTIKTR